MEKIAIIETGGKQHVVTDGSILKIEKIKGDFKVGDTITFDSVLLTDDGSSVQMGAPFIENAKVTAELLDEGRNKTVTVIKYKEKSRYFKKRGHRQPYMQVKVTSL